MELTSKDEFNYVINFALLKIHDEKSFQKLVIILKNNFVEESVQNCILLLLMIYEAYKRQNSDFLIQKQGINSIGDAIVFLQSRRAYFTTMLHLIPRYCKGKKKTAFQDTLNYFLYPVETCCTNITTANRKIVLSKIFNDYIETSNGIFTFGNYHFEYLESFFFEPERLSIIDQVENRNDYAIEQPKLRKLPNKRIFSYNEMLNSIDVIGHAYSKFGLHSNRDFIDVGKVSIAIEKFIIDNFFIVLKVNELKAILKSIGREDLELDLYEVSDDYFKNVNSVKPFVNLNDTLHSTVVLFTRYVYNLKNKILNKVKKYQVHSGFIFEDMVIQTLEKHGYKHTGITRINRKEFDLITIKNNVIHNFQCKNNDIDNHKVFKNIELLVRYNRFLHSYYIKAYNKEVNRENVIIEHLGISTIKHYVISRFPVISNLDYLIRFNELDEWLKNK